VLSAFGTLVTPMRVDLARTLVRPLDGVDAAERDALLGELRDDAVGSLQSAGIDAGDIRVRYGVDARYTGQGHEITVWMGEGDRWPVDAAEALRRFEDEYARVYGLSIGGIPVEVVTWRVAVYAPAPALDQRDAAPAGDAQQPRHRLAHFGRNTPPVEVPVFERQALAVGTVIDGPAVVEQRDTTTVLRPGWRTIVAPDGSLVANRVAALRGAPAVTDLAGIAGA
jgi:N-methylhydantoinase A